AVDRLVNFKPHECLTQLARQAEPGRAYAVLDSQARLVEGWLGFAVDDGQPVWTQFSPPRVDTLAIYEAVQGDVDLVSRNGIGVQANEIIGFEPPAAHLPQ